MPAGVTISAKGAGGFNLEVSVLNKPKIKGTMHAVTFILPVPDKPHEPPTGELWKAFSEEYYSAPDDYVKFMKAYGCGGIDGFLWFFTPGATNKFLNLERQTARQRHALAGEEWLWQGLGVGVEDFFPFAVTDNGDVLAWVADGTRPEWNVCVCNGRGVFHEYFPMSFETFLRLLLSKEIRCQLFPPDFPSEQPSFVKPI